MRRLVLLSVIVLFVVSPALADAASDLAHARKKYTRSLEAENFRRAASFAQRALILAEKLHGSDHETVAKISYDLGVSRWESEHSNEATEALRLALSRYENLYGADNVELLKPLIFLSRAEGKLSIPDAGVRIQRAVEIAENSYGETDPRTAALLLERAEDRISARSFDAAEEDARRADRVFSEAGDQYIRESGQALALLGKVEIKKGDFAPGEAHLLAALKIAEKNLPEAERDLTSAQSLLIELYQRKGEGVKATPYLQSLSRRHPDSRNNKGIMPIFYVAPIYPGEAAAAGIEGFVDLTFTIDRDGIVRKVATKATMATLVFMNSASDSVKQWRYKPKLVKGKFVEREGVEVRITFELEN